MIDCKYFKVSEGRLQEWEQAYSPLNVSGELLHMVMWLDANPRRRKKNYDRFVVNWLNKAYASVATAQVQARMQARVGQKGRFVDYTQECQEVLKKYPDLA